MNWSIILTDWLLSCIVNANLLTFHPKLKEFFFVCTEVFIMAKFWHSLWMIFTLISLNNLICLWKSSVAETRNVPVHIIICFYLACIRLVVEYCMPLYHSNLEDVECVQKCIDSVVSNTAHILHHLLPPKNISRYNFGNQRIFVSKNVHLIVTWTYLFHPCPIGRTFICNYMWWYITEI